MTSHLQRILNYAARVILSLPKSSNITTHLKSLYWFPVKVRRTYKIACLCYHCHNSTAPSYVTDMLQKKPSHTRNTRSSSYSMPLLNMPAHSKAIFRDGSFSMLLLYGTLLHMILSVPHHCHHLCHVENIFVLFIALMCMAWSCYRFFESLKKYIDVYKIFKFIAAYYSIALVYSANIMLFNT